MKFKLEIDLNNKMFEKEKMSALARLLQDVSDRLDFQCLLDGPEDGIIWDNDDNSIGKFGIYGII